MCATVSVDFPHWPLLWHEKTNVGVDNVDEVNSSTFIGPKFGLKSEIFAYKGGWGTLGAKSGGQKAEF